MKDNVLVSIVIPVYNVRPYLNEALDSVINQTYKNLEIILIDDGSSDGSEKVCDEYGEKDNRVKVIHQLNKGLSAARNAGLDCITGKCVAFLDSDDKYLPDYIRLMLSKMDQYNSDMVICKNTVLWTDNEMIVTGREETSPCIPSGLYDRITSLRARVDGSIDSHVWNKMYRMELWNGIRFPVGHVYEDTATIFLVLNRCKRVYVLDELLYIRRIHQGSITRSTSLKSQFDYYWALTQFEKFILYNTPEVFNYEHLQIIRRIELNQMIICYHLMLENGKKIADIECKALRKQVIKLGNDIQIEGNRHIIITYYLICYFPWLMRIVYSFFRLFRKVSSKNIRTLKSICHLMLR